MHTKFKTEAEWHTLREMHIGGSEVASLFNLWRKPDGQEVVRHLYEAIGPEDVCLGSLSPHKSGYRLYQEKRGKLLPEDLDEVSRIQAGQFMEPAIAAWAMRRWPDFKLHKSRVYHHHADVPGWGATLDYFERTAGKPPVEIKNVDGFVYRREWVEEEGQIVGFPLHIALQLQHQIGATGADKGWILACVGGNVLRRGLVPAHPGTLARIRNAITAFWAAVEEGLEPPDADFSSVKEVFFSGSDKDAAGARVDCTGDAEASLAARRLIRWQAHAKYVDGQIEIIKGRVARAIGEHYGADFDGASASWPTIHRPAGHRSFEVTEKTYRGALTMSKPKLKA